MSITIPNAAVDELLAKCAGTPITIPFLFDLRPKWQLYSNPHFGQRVEDVMEEWRRKWVTNPAHYTRNKQVGTGYFTSVAYPEAPERELQTLGKLITWIFAWDDLVDFGEFDNKHEARQAFLHETIEFIRKGFSDEPIIDAASVPTSHIMSGSIYEICVAFNREINSGKCVIRLQNGTDEGEILDLDTYLAIRMDSSCVYPTVAVIGYACQIEFPDLFFDNVLVKEYMRQVNIMISIDNDVASAHVEIKCTHVDNMIPILMHQGVGAQEAADHAAQVIYQSYLAIQKLEPQLLELAAKHSIQHDVQTFLSAVQKYCVGLVSWTYTTERYFKYDPSWGSVGMAVVLGQLGKGSPVMGGI
ncbi:Sesquiterpene synthase Agr1-like protein [Cladobotryum mycophilum]|uniref:Terpene synthase n=1 Tax=Cladobotryum mycophilum TaxID=491253 RepID=A0ABR0S8V8_9HYPO